MGICAEHTIHSYYIAMVNKCFKSDTIVGCASLYLFTSIPIFFFLCSCATDHAFASTNIYNTHIDLRLKVRFA